MLTESLRLLEQVAAIDEASSGTLRREEIPVIEQDSWRALDTFLAYAYARQGAPSAYAYAARKTVQGLAERRASWQETDLAQQAWQRYKDESSEQSDVSPGNPLSERERGACNPATKRDRVHAGVSIQHRLQRRPLG